MNKANYKQITCSILTVLLMSVPCVVKAAPALEKPGVQTDINGTEKEVAIKNATTASKTENNQIKKFRTEYANTIGSAYGFITGRYGFAKGITE